MNRQVQPLSEDIEFLESYGFSRQKLASVQERAHVFGVTPAQCLFAHGIMTEREYYRCVALELGLPFTPQTGGSFSSLHTLPSPDAMDRQARIIRLSPDDQRQQDDLFNLAPDCSALSDLRMHLDQNTDLRKRLQITTPSANKRCLEVRGSTSTLSLAINGLRDHLPSFSAKRVISASQAITLLLFLQLLVFLSWSNSDAVVLAVHLTASFFYIGCTALRFFAAIGYRREERVTPVRDPQINRSLDHQLPMYSVLVAVYQEAGQIDDLVDALLLLDWPRERLEIKIICEADDLATIEAVKAAQDRVRTSCLALLTVRPAKPRTKPKALNYALPFCSGEFLVIYDAEDRPNPHQLREAYSKFQTEPDEFACLQAPLVIYNHKEGWVSRLFAIEYSTLFDGLLPMLARIRAPLPLGGTSNHFKTAILRKVGAWDPFNVTEDADLGIRLIRHGYSIGVLRRPTYEEAPINLNVWLKQRTRWYKGWYQTLLVHMRNPFQLIRDLGLRNAFLFHLLITGMLVSALVHPVILYYLLARGFDFAREGVTATVSHPLIFLDITTILFGYLAFAFLAFRTLPTRRLTNLRTSLWLLPFYWMMQSAAAWRAFWHLIIKPHEWEKTPHRLRRKR